MLENAGILWSGRPMLVRCEDLYELKAVTPVRKVRIEM